MITNQEEFLNKLGNLFKEYSIEKMWVDDDGYITFKSTTHEIYTSGYKDGAFNETYVTKDYGTYKPTSLFT